MSSPLHAILRLASHIAKQNLTSEIVCPRCGERHCLIKWGFYTRYLFDSDDSIQIQRIRCLNQHCTRVTFSVLPHPFLPVLRMPLCFLLTLLSMHQADYPVVQLAQKSGKSWPAIRRALAIAERLESFLQKEFKMILGMASFCLQPAVSWTAFTHTFSWAFFPGRF